MRFERLQRLILMVALVGVLGNIPAQAGPLAVVANFTDPGLLASGPPWPPGTVSIIDTETDQPVTSPLTVGVNPMAVAITPDGTTAVVACAQSSELYFINLAANPPVVKAKLSVGSGSGDTFYPAGLAVSQDGKYVAVTSTVGGQQRSTQITKILMVQLVDTVTNLPLDTPLLLPGVNLADAESGFTAEAAAIGPKSIILVGPSANPPIIFALSYADGTISFPEPDDNNTQMGAFQNATGFNVTLTPDSKYALVPLGGSSLDLFRIDDSGKLTVAKELINSGGTGAHSAVFSPDGLTAYVRNLLPPQSNIAVFQFDPTAGNLTDTRQRLICQGIPQAVVALASYTQGAIGYVGSQTLAITPDGKKIYAANPFGGTPLAIYLGFYGAGNVQVFNAGNPAPVRSLAFGRNPIAIAIQQKKPAPPQQ